MYFKSSGSSIETLRLFQGYHTLRSGYFGPKICVPKKVFQNSSTSRI